MQVQGFATITILFCTLSITGCANPADELDVDDFGNDALELRSIGGDFWEWGANFAANDAIEVHEGEDVDIPDCLIWDIDTAGVTRQTSPGVFVDRYITEENDIFEIDPLTGIGGPLTCHGVQAGPWYNPSFKLVESNGDVAVTVWLRFVFAGDVEIPSFGDPALFDLLQNNVAFSFKKDHIYAGPWWNGDIVATANANLNKANPMRRLLLGSLVAGECGSAGVP